MKKQVAGMKLMIWAVMSFSFILFFASFVFAEESVAVELDVSDSVISWLYSGGVKEKIVGGSITFVTLLVSVGLYYLLKVF